MRKQILCSVMILSLFGFISINTVYASTDLYADNEETIYQEPQVQPKNDTYKWCYKIIDGKMYKRLYNCTTNKWAGKWILVK